MISQCNVMLPDAVRKMPKLERLVSVWQQLLQLTDCLAGLHRGPAGRGYRALRQSELRSLACLCLFWAAAGEPCIACWLPRAPSTACHCSA